MPALQFVDVAKRFTIHHERSRSLQELVLHSWRRRGWRDDFWALKDVSFAVEPGQALGVVGANGSGKSTLLKLATRLIQPTRGYLEVRGRVAALLELGAGFHPELSGRDNIYLNASILGIPRQRVTERFADIVAFAGVERFVDTPVKHYSSGMQARLGFAVAIHVDPDILLLDEVLAVGDVQFQERCVERIHALHRDGCTVLLVSHDLRAVTDLCEQTLWLHEGTVRALGPSAEVVTAYRRHLLGAPGTGALGQRATLQVSDADGAALAAAPELNAVEPPAAEQATGRRWGSGEVRLVDVELLDASGQPTRRLRSGAALGVRLRYRAQARVRRPVFGIAFYAGGLQVSGPNTRVDGVPLEVVEGEGEVVYQLDRLALLAGAYTLSAAIYDERELHPFDHHHQCYPFLVVGADDVERYGVVDLGGRWIHRAGAAQPEPAALTRASDPSLAQSPAVPSAVPLLAEDPVMGATRQDWRWRA